MHTQDQAGESPPKPNPWSGADVERVVRDKEWLAAEITDEHRAWLERAAQLLGPQAPDRAALRELLELIFRYDPIEALARVEAHVVLSRYAARDVLRETGRLLLEGGPLDSDRFKQIVIALKERLDLRSREILHPIRLALAGRVGEGELDRVILLLDGAAELHWAVPVKSARDRLLAFFAALD